MTNHLNLRNNNGFRDWVLRLINHHTGHSLGDMPLGHELVLSQDSYMDLTIYRPTANTVAVFHHYTQEGDCMYDPRYDFWVLDNDWVPLSFEMSGFGLYQVPLRIDWDNNTLTAWNKRGFNACIRGVNHWLDALKVQDWMTATVKKSPILDI